MKKGKKIALSVLGGLLAVFIILVGGGYLYVNSMLGKIEKVEVDKGNLSADDNLSEQYGKIENIALFGIDDIDGVTGRSDSIMILTIDRGRNKVKVSSIMRDSYVTIPGREGKDKINHAYAYGGPELAIKTLNENFGLNITDFITVNFTSLPKIIDLLGGVEIEIDSEELKFINSYIRSLNAKNGTSSEEITTTGKQLLNGTEAMAYCRIRYTAGGDYKRTERHREVLEAIFEKVQTISVTKYPELLNSALPMVKTSLSSEEILALGTDLVKIGGELEEDRFPRDGYCKSEMIDKVSYITFDAIATKNQIHRWIFEDKK